MRINGKRQIQTGTIDRSLFDTNDLGNIIELISTLESNGTIIKVKKISDSTEYELVNKTYVDSHIQTALQGLKVKRGVNGVIDGSSGHTFSDITNPSNGTRVLVIANFGSYNIGVYEYDGSNWVYQNDELEDGAYWFVRDDESWSIAQSGWGYVCTDPSTPIIEQFTGVGQLTAGLGIVLDSSTNTISAKINTGENELKLDTNGIGISQVSSDKINLNSVTSGKFLIKDPNTGKISAVNITASDPIIFSNDQISVKDATTTQKGVVILSNDSLPDGTVITTDVLKQKIDTLIQSYEITANQDGAISVTLNNPTNKVSVYAVFINGLKLSKSEFNSNLSGNQINITSPEIYNGDIVIVDVIQI